MVVSEIFKENDWTRPFQSTVNDVFVFDGGGGPLGTSLSSATVATTAFWK